MRLPEKNKRRRSTIKWTDRIREEAEDNEIEWEVIRKQTQDR